MKLHHCAFFTGLFLVFSFAFTLSALPESKFARELRKASERDNQKRLEEVLKSVPMPQVKGEINRITRSSPAMTPLFLAIKAGSPGNIKLLLHYGADVNCMDNMTEEIASYLLQTNEKKAKAQIREMQRTKRIYEKNIGTLSFLVRTHWWREDEQKAAEILKILLEAGADPNTQDPFLYWSPIMFFIDRGQSECVKLMLCSDKTDLTYKSMKRIPGQTGIDGVESIAKQHGKQPEGSLVLEKLRTGKIPASIKTKLKEKKRTIALPTGTPSMSVAEAVKQKNEEEFLLNLADLKDINAPVDKVTGRTILMEAVIGGTPRMVQAVLESDPVLDVRDSCYRYAYYYARQRNEEKILNLLTKAGAGDIPAKTIEEAVMLDRGQEVEEFAAKSKNATIRTRSLMYNMAVAYNCPHAFLALQKTTLDPVFILRDSEIEPDRVNLYQPARIPAPFLAIQNGQAGMLQYILQKKFIRTVRHPQTNETMLSYAVSSAGGKKATILILLLKDDDSLLSVPDGKGVLPLSRAILMKDENSVKLLLSAGADPALKDAMQKTAFDYAADVRYEPVLQLLKQHPKE